MPRRDGRSSSPRCLTGSSSPRHAAGEPAAASAGCASSPGRRSTSREERACSQRRGDGARGPPGLPAGGERRDDGSSCPADTWMRASTSPALHGSATSRRACARWTWTWSSRRRWTFRAGQYVQFLLPGTERRSAARVPRVLDVPRPPSRAARPVAPVRPRPRRGMHLVRVRAASPGRTGDDQRAVRCLPSSGRAIGRSSSSPEARGSRRSGRCSSTWRRSEAVVPATFFFSAHTAADLVYLEEMRALERRAVRASASFPCSRGPLPADGWDGERGGLPAALTRLLPVAG